MKTLAEFIQRLQDDPAFEKQAQTFDRGEDLIDFVKRQGYDFTLEQLMSEFEREEELPAKTGGLAPPPADVNPSPPPRPDQAEFPGQPEALSSPERCMALPKIGDDNFSRESAAESLPRPDPEEEPRVGLFRGGGGRHRGFSAQRLKHPSEEEP